jgi:hypothetical protein
MAEPDKKPCHVGRTSRLQPATDRCAGELLIEKGLITREEFMQKISEGTSDVSEATESNATMSIEVVGIHFMGFNGESPLPLPSLDRDHSGELSGVSSTSWRRARSLPVYPSGSATRGIRLNKQKTSNKD